MRIAMFSDSYKPQINGLVTSIDKFSTELRRQGHEVFIFAPAVPKYKDKDRNVYRVESIEFSNYKEYRIGLPFRLLLKKLPHFDVIHVHSPFPMGVTGLGVAKFYGVPVVATFHTMYNEYAHYFVKARWISNSSKFRTIFDRISWRYLRWFYGKCDLIIAPSEHTKTVLVRKGIKKKIIVIPTGTVVSKSNGSKAKLRKRYGFSQKDRIILHVGRITKEKNIEFLIGSLERLLKGSQNTVFVITSEGPYLEELKKKARSAGLSGKIIFTGYMAEEKLDDYYRLSDVFVMASSTETQGIVLLEAAKNGLPSVVLDAPVTSDFVRENGTGVVTKKKDFSLNVEKVLSDDRLSKKLRDRCNSAAMKYDSRECTRKLINSYAELIKERGSL